MNPSEYYNRPVAEWARQNIRGRVEVRRLFSSRWGTIFTYALLFCVPAAFAALGPLMFALGARDRATIVGPLVFALILMIPCGGIALLGAYVRRGFAKSLDAEGVSGSFGQRFLWGKLYYVDHVSKHVRAGRVSRQVKDNQLELVFEGGKVIIPPLIHDRAQMWELINRIPAEVRDDGVSRAARAAAARDELLAFLNSSAPPRNQGGRGARGVSASKVERRMDEPAFKQVSKGLFEDIYYRLGGGESTGWTADYWRKAIEPYTELGWRFMVEEPRSAEHHRMFVVTDHQALEHRLFFMTEQSEDSFMEWPGEG